MDTVPLPVAPPAARRNAVMIAHILTLIAALIVAVLFFAIFISIIFP